MHLHRTCLYKQNLIISRMTLKCLTMSLPSPLKTWTTCMTFQGSQTGAAWASTSPTAVSAQTENFGYVSNLFATTTTTASTTTTTPRARAELKPTFLWWETQPLTRPQNSNNSCKNKLHMRASTRKELLQASQQGKTKIETFWGQSNKTFYALGQIYKLVLKLDNMLWLRKSLVRILGHYSLKYS